ncbi:MAG: terminase small subunit [Anaerotignum propionicum]|nr:terminase small subunit [Anaerotignum propionicum]
MTPNQQKFADEYIKCGNAALAYKLAYPNITKQRTAESAGSRLLSNVEVVAYIDKRNAEIANERIAGMQEVKEYWTATMRDKGAEDKDRLKASEFIAKSNGAFIDRVKLENDSELTINIKGDFDDC